MSLINLITGIRFPVLFSMLARNRISCSAKIMVQLPVLLVNSLISSVLTLAEKIRFDNVAGRTVIEKPPVFIIGHWRSGTTYLHQLMHLDPHFTTPSLVQTVIPDHFLFSAKYYIPIMKAFMPKKRPMDEVTLSPLDPQEDEFALIRMGSVSPLEKLVFPVKHKYFLDGYEEYIPDGSKLETWTQNLLLFYQKITWLTGKPIVSKNPFHTMRISLLKKLFPGARFIYIKRHPFEVVPSTIKMWNRVSSCFSLNGNWKKPDVAEVASVLRTFCDQVAFEKQQFGKGQYAAVRFEDLEQNPLGVLKKLYAALNLEFSGAFENEVSRFLVKNKYYAKNIHTLTGREKEIIAEVMGEHMEEWEKGRRGEGE